MNKIGAEIADALPVRSWIQPQDERHSDKIKLSRKQAMEAAAK